MAFFAFLKDHPSGKINQEEFKELLKQALPKKYVNPMAEHIYRMYDENQDGSIDFKEFMADSTFAECDKDGDGKVTREEFIASCLDKGAFTTLLTMKIVDIFTAEEAPVAEAAGTPAPTDSPAPAAAAAPASDPTPAPAPEVAQ